MVFGHGKFGGQATLPARHLFIPYNAKIADITHADTNNHTLDLQTALTETRKIVGIILKVIRIAGTGNVRTYPNSGTTSIIHYTTDSAFLTVLASATNDLTYSLSVANDDFDFYCLGYVVET